jgi:hypothetical protein
MFSIAGAPKTLEMKFHQQLPLFLLVTYNLTAMHLVRHEEKLLLTG